MHLSSAQGVLPTRHTSAEVTHLHSSTRPGVPSKTTSAAVGAPQFNSVDTGHQLVFAHASTACRVAVLERRQTVLQAAGIPIHRLRVQAKSVMGNGALPCANTKLQDALKTPQSPQPWQLLKAAKKRRKAKISLLWYWELCRGICIYIHQRAVWHYSPRTNSKTSCKSSYFFH